MAFVTPPPRSIPESAQIDNWLEQFHSMTNLICKRTSLPPLGDQWVLYSDPNMAGSYSFTAVLMNRLRDAAKADTSLTPTLREASQVSSRISPGGHQHYRTRNDFWRRDDSFPRYPAPPSVVGRA